MSDFSFHYECRLNRPTNADVSLRSPLRDVARSIAFYPEPQDIVLARLNPDELREFLFGKTLNCYDPESRAHISTANYGLDGVCRMTFSDGTEDEGVFGLVNDLYWTQYKRFRSGTLNHFYLEWISPQIAQAFHSDGRRAFLQTSLSTAEIDALESC